MENATEEIVNQVEEAVAESAAQMFDLKQVGAVGAGGMAVGIVIGYFAVPKLISLRKSWKNRKSVKVEATIDGEKVEADVEVKKKEK